MSLPQLHQVVANALLLLMLLLGLWGLLMALVKRGVGGSYRSTYVLAGGVFGLQAVIGLVMLIAGFRPKDWLHLLYGIVPFVALAWAWGYAAKTEPRRESLALGVAALFTFGLVIRAMTTGR
jgi:heme A synthase